MDDPFWLTFSIQYGMSKSEHIAWHILTNFRSAFPFYTPQKYEKSRGFLMSSDRFSDVFRGYRKVTLAWNGLKNRFSSECILRVLWALIYYLCPEGIFLSNNLNQCSFKYFLSILIIQQRKGFPLTMFHIKLSELSHEH